MNVTIIYLPTTVAVFDDRGSVAGAHVEVTTQGAMFEGDLIPAEGPDLTCWVPAELIDATDIPGMVDAFREAADQGARGNSGVLLLVPDLAMARKQAV